MKRRGGGSRGAHNRRCTSNVGGPCGVDEDNKCRDIIDSGK